MNPSLVPDGKKVCVLTAEGADDAEIIIRPCDGGGWRVELPCGGGIEVTLVSSQQEALALARQRYPNAQIRVLPGRESAETNQDDLSPC
ncbi:hypothetical protein [Caballeronia sp. J97]|uniref:hypothetical protein n=1 Tax=Caballeronia sp. J97 TaxID=2805429 RepID=UPI002AB1FC04|nr:hypothetical protein [Caballeronia sp. J97]